MLASCSWPRRDSSSFFLQHFRDTHSCSVFCNLFNFSDGSLSSSFTVSSTMPRKIRHTAGPSCLVNARGMLSILQVYTNSARLRSHSLVPGAPAVMKSSRKWSRYDTPRCIAIHWRASATALKILGAERRPKGRVVSTYRQPSHSIPISQKTIPIAFIDRNILQHYRRALYQQ